MDDLGRVLVNQKAAHHAENLMGSQYDLIGNNVEFLGEEDSIDILLVGFGRAPVIRVENYFLGSIGSEIEISDTRSNYWRELMPGEDWSYTVSNIRISRDEVDGDETGVEWEWCYQSLDEEQFRIFQEEFLGYDPCQREDTIFVELGESYSI